MASAQQTLILCDIGVLDASDLNTLALSLEAAEVGLTLRSSLLSLILAQWTENVC